jgi:Ca-activated chloride channel family protein
LRAARLCAWLAVAAVVIAAAQPSVQAAPRQRVGILELVVDRSGSTLAGDLAPTRLAAIQQATLELLDRAPKRLRVGVVAFSDKAVTVVRPTTDRDAVRAALTSLRSGGGTAAGDALRRALGDVQAASGSGPRAAGPAAPAAVLLLSDGASTTGTDPLEAARTAAERRVPVHGVAVGTPYGVLSLRGRNVQRVQAVPPDPALLAGIAAAAGGRAAEARTAPALRAALDDLGRDAGIPGPAREVTPLVAAVALLLLAVGNALSPRRAAPGARTGPPAAVRRLAPSVALLVAAAGAVVAWTQWPPAAPPPHASQAVAEAALAARAALARPLPPPPFVAVTAASGRDRTLVRQAIALLRRHRELADQRLAELDRHGNYRIEELRVSACDVCEAEPLTAMPTIGPAIARSVTCGPNLNTPILRRVARRAQVPAGSLAAMVLLYEQELCVHGRGGGSPFDAGLRLAGKLGDGRLFDLLFAQVDAETATDWRRVQQGVALLRRHGELGGQRWEELDRPRRNRVEPLEIQVCRDCLSDVLGDATANPSSAGVVGCDIRMDLAAVERTARGWGLPLTQVVASLLVHEQEHCVRAPDDRETPAIDAERRLARKLGGPRLLELVASRYRQLDSSGHWKR